jgi:hypothetical protein
MDHLMHPHRGREGKEKRRSLGHAKLGDRPFSGRESNGLPAHLDIIIESPPLVFYGGPAQSTGALLSGRLRLIVADLPGEVILRAFRMRLMSTATSKKPVSKDCPNCTARVEELSKWEFLTEPIHLRRGGHDFPFSYLLPGNLPATTHGSLGTVEYHLSARAVTAAGEELHLKMPLDIQRAIMPGNSRSSIRIFPPTNLTGRVVLPSVVHPAGSFPVQMTLSGIVDKSGETHTRWRLRKLMWRVEEHQKIISSACAKHAYKTGGEGKGMLHQETRIIGHSEEKSGWKTDFDTAGGEITAEFDASIRPNSNAVCDLAALRGGALEIKHNLVLELIVAEEFCPNRSKKPAVPTGAARVLRMLFHLNMTERSDQGISWDEEMPPVYGEVPASPPGYDLGDGDGSMMEEYRGSALELPEYEELERLDMFDRLDRDDRQSTARRPSSIRDSLYEISHYETRGRPRLTADDLIAEPRLPRRRPIRNTSSDEEDSLMPDIGRALFER